VRARVMLPTVSFFFMQVNPAKKKKTVHIHESYSYSYSL